MKTEMTLAELWKRLLQARANGQIHEASRLERRFNKAAQIADRMRLAA